MPAEKPERSAATKRKVCYHECPRCRRFKPHYPGRKKCIDLRFRDCDECWRAIFGDKR